MSSQVACRGACLFGATMTQSSSSASNWNSGRRLHWHLPDLDETNRQMSKSITLSQNVTNQFNFIPYISLHVHIIFRQDPMDILARWPQHGNKNVGWPRHDFQVRGQQLLDLWESLQLRPGNLSWFDAEWFPMVGLRPSKFPVLSRFSRCLRYFRVTFPSKLNIVGT